MNKNLRFIGDIKYGRKTDGRKTDKKSIIIIIIIVISDNQRQTWWCFSFAHCKSSKEQMRLALQMPHVEAQMSGTENLLFKEAPRALEPVQAPRRPNNLQMI